MLSSLSQLSQCTISATDGRIGRFDDGFFDDHSWTIRYMVVRTGNWLHARKALISSCSIKQPVNCLDDIQVGVTCQQVENSPQIDTDQPISRQQELQHLSHYGHPQYWGDNAPSAMGADPLPALDRPSVVRSADVKATQKSVIAFSGQHLRSGSNLKTCQIDATDGSIGHVKDFIFDTENWAIRYLVVDTSNWWPSSARVLVGVRWIEAISWGEQAVRLKLTREQIRSSPPLDPAVEQRLHASYGGAGYWI